MAEEAAAAGKVKGRGAAGGAGAALRPGASGGPLWQIGLRRRGRKRCAVQAEAGRVAGMGRDLARGLRRLKRSLRLCRDCARWLDSPAGECPRLAEFNAWVGAAIAEVVEEWERG
ncbi:MAG TPA: hypothetical protein VF498_06420 [Anaerolineales bacterium]